MTVLSYGQCTFLLFRVTSTCPKNTHPAADTDSVGDVPMVTSNTKPSWGNRVRTDCRFRMKGEIVADISKSLPCHNAWYRLLRLSDCLLIVRPRLFFEMCLNGCERLKDKKRLSLRFLPAHPHLTYQPGHEADVKKDGDDGAQEN